MSWYFEVLICICICCPVCACVCAFMDSRRSKREDQHKREQWEKVKATLPDRTF